MKKNFTNKKHSFQDFYVGIYAVGFVAVGFVIYFLFVFPKKLPNFFIKLNGLFCFFSLLIGEF